ncbi:MAG: hypothetical protein CUN55_04495 [Phototrophicales bacterium]|nr:MAG: hypothetical protein CUN55_04495 [Phototrophicales bacterium]
MLYFLAFTREWFYGSNGFVFKQIPFTYLVGFVVGLVIVLAMIAGVTLLASNVISETVQEQFQTQQNQIANSAARQVEAYFTQLSIESFQLSQNEAIQSIARRDDNDALIAIGNNITENGRFGITRSVVQFRLDPDEPSGLAARRLWRPDGVESDVIPFTLPDGAMQALNEISLAGTESGMIADTRLFYRASRSDNPSSATYVLITPFITRSSTVEFLAHEIDIEAAMADVLADVIADLDQTETGQIWIFDYSGNLIFRSGAALLAGTPADVFERREIIAINDTTSQTYQLGDTEYNGTFSPATLLGRKFIVLVSRDSREASELIAADLRTIFMIAVGAVLLLLTFAFVGFRQLLREIGERQEQSSMQRATRTLLEVSRALNSTLNFEEVMEEVLSELRKIIPYYSASILLLNNRGELEVAAHQGEDVEQHANRIFSIEETAAAREVITSGRPVIIDDTSVDPRWSAMEGSDIKSWMGLPLRMRDEFVGVLNVNSSKIRAFSEDDIEMAEAFADQASVALQNARLHDRDVTRFERELALARTIQSSLLPTDEAFNFPHLQMAFESKPARQVSGDYFQIIPLPDGKVGIFVGDVSGKGMPAALIMAVLTTALRDEVVRYREPGALLNRLNERLLERLLQVQMNSALIAAIFDPEKYEIAIANAGMVQPYWRTPTQPWDFVDVGGYPLGASQRTNYSQRVVKLPPGSMMVLFSDGIIEAQDPRGDFFGFERLEALLETFPPDIDAYGARDRILNAVNRHLAGQDAQDDLTIMVIQTSEVTVGAVSTTNGATPTTAIEDSTNLVLENKTNVITVLTQQLSASEPLIDEEYVMPRENVEIFIPSILGFEKVARSAAEALAKQMGFPDEKVEDVKTAVAEAVMNAIEHGNLEDKATSVTVMMSASDEHLEIRVQDRGRQIIPNPLPAPGREDSTRGWGLFFMQNLMDEFEVSRSPEGNEIRMTIFLNGANSSEEDVAKADEEEWVDESE